MCDCQVDERFECSREGCDFVMCEECIHDDKVGDYVKYCGYCYLVILCRDCYDKDNNPLVWPDMEYGDIFTFCSEVCRKAESDMGF